MSLQWAARISINGIGPDRYPSVEQKKCTCTNTTPLQSTEACKGFTSMSSAGVAYRDPNVIRLLWIGSNRR